MACEFYIRRLIEKVPGSDNYQVGVLAMNHKGRIGACSVQNGFTYYVGEKLREAKSIINKHASIMQAMQVLEDKE